jgi:hypothetical protein
VSGRILIFTPASLLLEPAGAGVRPVLPTLDLAHRRGARVVLLWDGPDPGAGGWSAETLEHAPFIDRPRAEWAEAVRSLAASGKAGGKTLTVGIGDSPADLAWLRAVDRPYLVGAQADGARTVPSPAGYGWRLAVEEVLCRGRS